MASKANTPATTDTQPMELEISDETRALFASMIVQVPDAEGSAVENILLAILNADSWDKLDAPWNSESGRAYADREVWIDSILRRPSDFTEGLGFFLVVKGRLVGSDDEIVWTTGSVAIICQLVKAYLLGAFPLGVILRVAERPTERGYHPMHLEIMGSGSGAPVK